MSIDRLLTTVLQLFQDVHDDARTEQLYASTTALLTSLSNPLNLSLLTSQLLTAPAIWARRDGMRACFRIISIYNTAAIHVRRNEIENAKIQTQAKKDAHLQPSYPPPFTQPQRVGGGLSSDAWAAAVLKGADGHSGRWQHLLVFTGVLMGMEGADRRSLSPSMRRTVERAVVTAANLALRIRPPEPPAPEGPVAMALNYAFPLLSESSLAGLDCDALVPVITRAMFGPDGLQDGLFLASIDQDVRQADEKFVWLPDSPSFRHLQLLEQRPLVSSLGPLARLLGHAVEHARDSAIVLQLQDDLVAFTSRLLQNWQANKLSELEVSEEAIFLKPETLETTWPVLWQFLKKIMYAVVAALHSVAARSLIDRRLRRHDTAPAVAVKTLHALRNLYFISSRNGSDAFQAYAFTYLTSLDTLSRYGPASAAFLRETRNPAGPSVPPHPLHRTLDLFYLNTAEHLPLHLSTPDADALIIQPATAYLTPPHPGEPLSPQMVQLFEAAHSAVLATLSCPHNASLAASLVPFYAESLLAAFPLHLSPRQFRLAFTTLMRILSPPALISAQHPDLPETLLEMVRFRAVADPRTSTTPLLPSLAKPAPTTPTPEIGPVSEQSTLVLTLVDSLPYLPLPILEEWMALAAAAIHAVRDKALREVVQRRFWEVLVSGEMDVERAAVAAGWWGTKGGREAVVFGVGLERLLASGWRAGDEAIVRDLGTGGGAAGDGEVVMSGALPPRPERESRL
ncbi:hypothetical protein VTJ04DRAFT_248 [Mycothermus thermophilus]|uniref:uncharacterized protein n=1 Tax=Humicola insolens TaxID=85995 RepID=UPI0037445B2A